jgi:hypothetical protein
VIYGIAPVFLSGLSVISRAARSTGKAVSNGKFDTLTIGIRRTFLEPVFLTAQFRDRRARITQPLKGQGITPRTRCTGTDLTSALTGMSSSNSRQNRRRRG